LTKPRAAKWSLEAGAVGAGSALRTGAGAPEGEVAGRAGQARKHARQRVVDRVPVGKEAHEALLPF